MKTTTLHMIGNAHIDPVWLWQWQEGFHEVKATFRSALDRMNEYPEFKFVASSAVYYQWVEENDPTMFAEIKKRVAEGRWEIVGGWWIEPDCNIPGGESFVRQGLYGQRYFKSRFGAIATVGYNIDSFGHNAMLPQILKKSGISYYVFMRPAPHEKSLPGRLFWWESPDGTRVLTLRLPAPYGTWAADIQDHITRCANEISEPLNEMACFYGVGDHGGGPTIENIECILRLNQQENNPTLLFSTPKQFFNAVDPFKNSFPVVHDDLQHHASGCYSAHSGIKRWVRQAENKLLTAEKFSSIAASLTGLPYAETIPQAWKNLLFNQFHDILAGTSLEIAYEDSRNQLGETISIAERALNNAIQSLAWNINISEKAKSSPIIVFNPHAWGTKTNIELEMGELKGNAVIVDDNNVQYPLQLIQSQSTTTFRSRISFTPELPALGYALFHIKSLDQESNSPVYPASNTVIENDNLRLEVDQKTGGIKSLFDKVNLRETLSASTRAVVIDDPSDTWSHDILTFDDVIGDFELERISLVEHGPVKSVIRSESIFGNSRLTQDFTLFQGLDWVKVDVTVDWHEQQKMLKLRFPINLSSAVATYEIPYGFIQRPTNGIEFPGQSWVDLTGSAGQEPQTYGMSLLNDSKYSFDIQNNEIGLTVLRSPIYAHHNPAVPQPGIQYNYIDQGVQHFAYILLPHAGNWQKAGTIKRALELNQLPIALASTIHHGSLPASASFLSVDRENIIVSVIKKAEDGDGLILRIYETAGYDTQAKIHLPFLHRAFQVDFKPCEIKTFLIPFNAALPPIETNLLEYLS